MSKRGLASPQKDADSILSMTRKAFGKSNKQPRSLEQRLQGLSEKDLKLVLQTAQFVKLANGMGKQDSYKVTADYMYPKMNTGIRRLVAEVLEDAEPLNIPDNRAAERDRLQQAALASYAHFGTLVDTAEDVPIKMKGRVVDLTEEEKAEQLKDKILESLKLND